MAKGPIVTPAVETFIASVYRKHPKWKAKEVRNWTISEFKRKNPNLPKDWPSLSTVQKVLAIVRKKMKETPIHPEDKRWTMGMLSEYPIPPDAIPAVLKVWKLREEYKYRFRKIEGFDFSLTIRQAKWVSRLSHVIVDNTETLFYWADEYASIEATLQLVNHPFDSIALDYELARPDRPLPDELVTIRNQIISQIVESGEFEQIRRHLSEVVAKHKREAKNERQYKKKGQE